MPSESYPAFRNILLAMVCAVAAWCLWPPESADWRRFAGMALGAALGFHIGLALFYWQWRGRVAAMKASLDCVAFPLAMGAFYFLPSPRGWILLLGSWVWRFLVRNLWTRKC